VDIFLHTSAPRVFSNTVDPLLFLFGFPRRAFEPGCRLPAVLRDMLLGRV